jgi:hypothetical protein
MIESKSNVLDEVLVGIMDRMVEQTQLIVALSIRIKTLEEEVAWLKHQFGLDTAVAEALVSGIGRSDNISHKVGE